jgi:hypothetical protein
MPSWHVCHDGMGNRVYGPLEVHKMREPGSWLEWPETYVTDQEIRLRSLMRAYMLGMGLCSSVSAFLLGWVLGRVGS